jgi:Rrf2 family nitric oxide-sensitive transcriptional repressor
MLLLRSLNEMRLTQYTDYGLRLLIYLSTAPERSASVREVAEAFQISRPHLNKVARQLSTNGVLRSRRGRGGGLQLAAPPDRILLGNVIRLLEPDFHLVECMRPDNQCVITPACKLREICQEAFESVIGVFDRYTLADLLKDDDRRFAVCELLNLEY